MKEDNEAGEGKGRGGGFTQPNCQYLSFIVHSFLPRTTRKRLSDLKTDLSHFNQDAFQLRFFHPFQELRQINRLFQQLQLKVLLIKFHDLNIRRSVKTSGAQIYPFMFLMKLRKSLAKTWVLKISNGFFYFSYVFVVSLNTFPQGHRIQKSQ